MQFTNLTGGNEIGANCYLLEMEGVKILLDCGMNPKKEGRASLPRLDIPDADGVDHILMSHCHMDHLGSLPVAQRAFPSAEIHMTEPSVELASIMLHNSCNIMAKEKERTGHPDYPLFTHREVDRQEKSWRPHRFTRPFDLAARSGGTDIEVTPLNAGHVLGSASFLFDSGHERALYTGDINLSDQSLMRKAELSGLGPLDLLIIEGTRGLTAAGGAGYREAEIERFAQTLNAVLERGGNVLLPCFALGKQQETLAMLKNLMDSGKLPDYPVMIGGMGKQISLVYDLYREHDTRRMEGFSIFEDFCPQVIPRDGSKWWRTDVPTIFAISAGMLTEMTPAYTAAGHFLSDPSNAILFVGYVDPDTPGGRILSAVEGGAPVVLGENDSAPREIRCRVEKFDFTAHALRDDLVALATALRPRKTLLVHGDTPALEWLRDTLRARGLDADLPDGANRLEI